MAATWISSIQKISSHTGPVTWYVYSTIVVTAPTVTCPCEARYPPQNRTAAGASTNAPSMPGNRIVRRRSVAFSAANASRRSSSTRAIRRRPRRRASTVRAPSTDSVMVPLSVAYAADSRWYAGVARLRYQRTRITSVGTPMNIAIETSGDTTRHATIVSVMVTTATITRGTPKRTACCSLFTSLVVRATRSPVPARSTVDSGSAVTFSMNSSRSSAKTSSPNTIDERCAKRMSTVCASTATAPMAMSVLT